MANKNASWWNEEVYEAFRLNDIIFCSVSHPKLPEDIIVTASTAYVRLHGVPQQFYSSYSDYYLLNLHNILIDNPKIEEGYVFFNNTAGTAGILNAQQFKVISQSSRFED